MLRTLIQEILIGHTGNKIPYNFGRLMLLQIIRHHIFQKLAEDNGRSPLVPDICQVFIEKQFKKFLYAARMFFDFGIQINILQVKRF